MINTKDIKERIELDFKNRALETIEILNNAIINTQYLNSPRIIRCILFLAEGDIEKLKRNIQAAKEDPRDVMLWAEYINLSELHKIKRVRDFNKTFDTCEQDVKE